MMNLFENFDPSNSYWLSMNWIIALMPLLLSPHFYWLIPSRLLIMWSMLMKIMFNEFKMISTNKYSSNLIMMISMMIYIMLLNLLSLTPYIYTITSQMSFNLILAMTFWTSFTIYMLFKTPVKFLTHLVPNNTPTMLMNFMVLIELISNIIRPWTLAIRLTANLTAGHLLMTLLSTFISKLNIEMMMILTLLQNMLLTLEIAMALIQSYVYTILSTLYFSESKK